MNSSARLLLTGMASLALLAGCDRGSDKDAKGSADDPAVAGALDDDSVTDPLELPPEQRTPEAIEAAKKAARKLAGGSLQSAPQPSRNGDTASLVENAAMAAQVGQSSKAANVDCAEKAEYSMTWANRLPDALSVYPRGAVQEAAGIDGKDCNLRVVSFVTPVTPDDVVDFYYTRTRGAGYGAQYKLDGKDHVLGGSKGAAAYLLYARKLDNGLTEVDLIASGT